MIRPSSGVSFHHDPFSRSVMRLLLLLQLGAMVVVLGLCLLERFVPALLISFLTLLLFPVVLVWLYARYRSLPDVCEKKTLTQLVLKFEKNLQAEQLRIYAAVRERSHLVRSEKQEIHTAALPPEQLERIKQKYHALQDENNAAERKAIASQQILEHELMSLKPRLRGLAEITFLRYFGKSLASRGIVAALVAFVLFLTQAVSSVSATVAFDASDAAAFMGSIPIAARTPTIASTSTNTSAPISTSTPAVTATSTATAIPSETSTLVSTSNPSQTFTPLPTLTSQPENTPTLAALPASSGNCDPSYPGVCIPPAPPDLDCKDVPYDNFIVLPPDPHNFDREGDGLGCEG